MRKGNWRRWLTAPGERSRRRNRRPYKKSRTVSVREPEGRSGKTEPPAGWGKETDNEKIADTAGGSETRWRRARRSVHVRARWLWRARRGRVPVRKRGELPAADPQLDHRVRSGRRQRHHVPHTDRNSAEERSLHRKHRCDEPRGR